MCALDRNPLFIQCKGDKQAQPQKSGRKAERNGYFRKRTFTEVGTDDVVVRNRLRGVQLSPGPAIKVFDLWWPLCMVFFVTSK